MKKILLLTIAAALAFAAFAGCAQPAPSAPEASASPSVSPETTASPTESPAASESASPTVALTPIKVGASPAPHAEILAVIKDALAEQGYDLQVTEFTDYIQPNAALASGDLDANYFQHQPYLDQYNEQNGTDIISVGAIHFEPLGIYPGKTKTLDALKDGAQVAVPNDATNEARALLLLQDQGLITLKADAGINATKNNVDSNPKKLDIIEVDAAQLARSLPDVDIAVINGNYAIEAGLNVSTDALASEKADSLAATTYANIVAVRSGDKDRAELKALAAALQSDDVRTFINDTYKGAVVPVF